MELLFKAVMWKLFFLLSIALIAFIIMTSRSSTQEKLGLSLLLYY